MGATTAFDFTVSLSAPSEKTVTASFGTGDGTARMSDGDYFGTSGSLSLAPGLLLGTRSPTRYRWCERPFPMHAIAFGKRLFGRVDRVPGRFHVATLCFHFCYLPLVPLGTFLVLKASMSGMTTTFDGVRIPFSLKSWLIAWSRSILWFLFVIACVGVSAEFFPGESDPPPPPEQKLVVSAVAAAIALLLFGPHFVKGLGRATRARAAKLEAFAAAAPVSTTARAVHW